jgi:outer membrane protein OmpA-like peptidoglycan-associated protein
MEPEHGLHPCQSFRIAAKGLLVAALLTLSVAGCADASAAPAAAALSADSIPLHRGATVTQAVRGESKGTAAGKAPAGIAVGDHETTLTLEAATSEGVRILFRSLIRDARGGQRWLSIIRRVRKADLQDSALQILGFHTDDAEVIDGSTAIGPSMSFLQRLTRDSHAFHSFRNFASQADISGSLQRVSTVAFPVLLNGERTTVPAIVARGMMGVSGVVRPTEWHFLDHPSHPITLKVSWGARGADSSAPAEWSRQVVSIDFESTLARRLAVDCRARVPGIYFGFDSDALDPTSAPALGTIAKLLQQHPAWTVQIEGHTDNVGGAGYNLDLSTRRAAAVRRALATDYAIAAARMTAHGFGLTQPVESNDTVEGRARNRRVELVRPCVPAESSGR